MTSRSLHVVVPGSLDQRTGGYVYDARIVAGLRERGWTVTVHELVGDFPGPDEAASRSLTEALSTIDAAAPVVIDGLAMGAHPEAVRPHAGRLVLVALVHHPLAEETGLPDATRERLRQLEREALAVTRGVVVTSAFTARGLRSFGVPDARVRVVEPGVDPAGLARGPGDDLPPRLLCVASVTRRKGQDVLVRALSRLETPEWTCVCAGSLSRDPGYVSEVRGLIERLGLTGHLRLTGELDRPDLDVLYERSTLFVLPSYYEGYGMVLTEALARGLPIVATTAGAVPATVGSAASVLVPPGDEEALARGLDDALGPARLKALAEAARRRRRTLQGWDAALAGFEAAILDLVANGTAP